MGGGDGLRASTRNVVAFVCLAFSLMAVVYCVINELFCLSVIDSTTTKTLTSCLCSRYYQLKQRISPSAIMSTPADLEASKPVPKPTENDKEPSSKKRKVDQTKNSDDSEDDEITQEDLDPSLIDPDAAADREIIAKSTPTSELEIALKAELDRQIQLNERLKSEVDKLKIFISKRKRGGYRRKRKGEDAPRKNLSAYNVFVRERFAKLAKSASSTRKCCSNCRGGVEGDVGRRKGLL